jgi:hypothetical protein
MPVVPLLPREFLPHRVRAVPWHRRTPRSQRSHCRREFGAIRLEIVPLARLRPSHQRPRRSHSVHMRGHCYQGPETMADRLREMTEYVKGKMPPEAVAQWWGR